MKKAMTTILFRIIVGLITIAACLPIMTKEAGVQTTPALYFISGIPYSEQMYEDDVVPIQILRVSDDTKALTMVRELLPQSTNAAFIRAYHDKRLLIIASPLFNIKNLIILNMDDPCRPTNVNIEGAEFNALHNYLLDIPNKGLYFAKKGYSRQDKSSWRLIYNFMTGQEEQMPSGVFRYALLPGSPVADMDDDWMDLFLDEKGNIWESAITKSIPNGINFNWPPLPNGAQPIKRTATIHVNGVAQPMADATWCIATPYINLIYVAGAAPEKKNNYQLFDKSRNEWRTLAIPGPSPGRLPELRPFGTWLAATLLGEKVETEEKINSLADKLKKEGRKDAQNSDYFPKNPKQEIFIYDAKSDESYKIKTDDIETKVLLIDNYTVYYRVKDRLYQATLSHGEAINTKLIARDRVLMNVYWAFFGPQCEKAPKVLK